METQLLCQLSSTHRDERLRLWVDAQALLGPPRKRGAGGVDVAVELKVKVSEGGARVAHTQGSCNPVGASLQQGQHPLSPPNIQP